MKITFLGGTEGIGASCIMVETIDSHGKLHCIMMDCGLHPGEEGQNRLPALTLLDPGALPDTLLLSHAHIDHTGAVPCILRMISGIHIFCTQPTRDIMHALLTDSARLMASDTAPLYSEAEAQAVCDSVKAISFMNSVRLAPGIYARFIQAGHIIGASGILLDTPDGLVLYTGDYSTHSTKTIGAQLFQKISRKLDIIITEATYGDKSHPEGNSEETRLKMDIHQTIRNGGKILIPSFSVGRAQELLFMLRDMKLDIPVYIDGMIQTINLIYEANSTFLKGSVRYGKTRESIFNHKGFYQVCSKSYRNEVLEYPGSCIILSSGGMLTGGTSVHYAGNILEESRNLLAFVGHQDPETPGGKLLDFLHNSIDDNNSPSPLQLLEIGGQSVSIRCRVEKYCFSAHADMEGITSLIKTLEPKLTLLVHGETPALNSMKARLLAEGIKAEIPSLGQTFSFDTKTGKPPLILYEKPVCNQYP